MKKNILLLNIMLISMPMIAMEENYDKDQTTQAEAKAKLDEQQALAKNQREWDLLSKEEKTKQARELIGHSDKANPTRAEIWTKGSVKLLDIESKRQQGSMTSAQSQVQRQSIENAMTHLDALNEESSFAKLLKEKTNEFSRWKAKSWGKHTTESVILTTQHALQGDQKAIQALAKLTPQDIARLPVEGRVKAIESLQKFQNDAVDRLDTLYQKRSQTVNDYYADSLKNSDQNQINQRCSDLITKLQTGLPEHQRVFARTDEKTGKMIINTIDFSKFKFDISFEDFMKNSGMTDHKLQEQCTEQFKKYITDIFSNEAKKANFKTTLFNFDPRTEDGQKAISRIESWQGSADAQKLNLDWAIDNDISLWAKEPKTKTS